MIVKLSEQKEVVVKWRRDEDNHTYCSIKFTEKDDNGTTGFFSYGTARLAKGDQFNKDMGRKISLTRALQGVGALSKEEKRRIWETYRTMTKTPRW